MRFAPAAAALSLALAMTSSVGWAGDDAPTPRAAVLIAEGEAALAQGDTQGAIDAFEAALAVVIVAHRPPSVEARDAGGL